MCGFVFGCFCGRAPLGARGLKFHGFLAAISPGASRPAWGAWIEMELTARKIFPVESRPAWGAWIEIECLACRPMRYKVAPRLGRVD